MCVVSPEVVGFHGKKAECFCYENWERESRTSKEVIAREVVGPDGHEDHGDGKEGELCHDAAVCSKPMV